jgi:hypothetical protein
MGSAGNFLPWVGQSFHDFAGSTVVHTIGGFIAIAGAIVLGPRLGRTFKRDGGGPMMPHDLTIAACGGLLLWFGWYGFNPGSTLSAMDFVGIGRVAANTTLAACAAGLTAMIAACDVGQMGCLVHVKRIPGGSGCDHVSVLLGHSDRSDSAGRNCGICRSRGRRTPGMAAHRRSDRRMAGTRSLRYLGHAFARPLRIRSVWSVGRFCA